MSRMVSVEILAAFLLALALAGTVWGAEAQGKIKTVDPAGRIITLEDGTQLTIPATVRLKRTALMPGAEVKTSYEKKNGEKLVRIIDVHRPEKWVGPARGTAHADQNTSARSPNSNW
jgi:hypothetical protein